MKILKVLIRKLMKLRNTAYEKNLINIGSLLETNFKHKYLDLGCDNGIVTKRFVDIIKTKDIYGCEIVIKQAKLAQEKGIKVFICDLTKKLPFEDSLFDVVTANQVIEHLNNTDNFVSEIYRILKPSGYAVISTENLSSWHNIFALILGFTPFSLTNTTAKTAALGNPLDPNANKRFKWKDKTWQHQKVFTLDGLIHLFRLYGFKIEKILASGYYPLPNFFSNLDKRHSAFITIKVRK